MKKILVILVFLFVFSFSCINTSADAVTSTGAIYQTFINYMRSNNSTAYTDYNTYGQGIIIRAGLDHQYNYYLNNRDYNLSYWQSQANNNNIYPLYIFASYKGVKLVNYANTFSNNGITYYYNIVRDTGSQSVDVFVLMSDGTIQEYINKSFYNIYWNSSVEDGLIWSDEDIYIRGDSIVFFQNTKNQLLEGNTFNLTGYESGYQMYTKLLDWMNYNNNYYINIWALGTKPTCAIFRNNQNIVASRINASNPNIVSNDYLAVFYPDRLCEYIQNNNSSHFNLFSLSKPLFYVLFDASGNINFYFMGPQNSQNDVALITNIRNDELVFCNSNIIQKSSANDFVLNAGNHTYSYISESEHEKYFPVSPDYSENSPFSGPIELDLSNLEGYIGDVEDNQISILTTITNFFSSFWDNLLNGLASLWETSTEAVQAVFTTVKNSLSNLLPIRIISDFTSLIQRCYNNGINTTPDLFLHFTFLGSSYDLDLFSAFREHKSDILPYIRVPLFFALVYYNINNIFVVFGGKKIL